MSETLTPSPKKRRGRPRSKYPNLRVWRLALNLNQHEAALVCGVNQTKYSRLERRLMSVKGAEAKHILERTGVPLEVLVGIAS